MLRDLNVAVPASDARQVEVVASGVSAFGGAQLAIDVTVRSPLTCTGRPRPRADWCDGATAESARNDKVAKYPELVSGSRCRLVVLAIEAGGRFSAETGEFLRQLSESRARSAPAFLRRPTALAFERRWSRMLACTVASSLCASLLLDKDALAAESSTAGIQPWLQDVLTECRHDCSGDRSEG
jgi:hypothetical protein